MAAGPPQRFIFSDTMILLLNNRETIIGTIQQSARGYQFQAVTTSSVVMVMASIFCCNPPPCEWTIEEGADSPRPGWGSSHRAAGTWTGQGCTWDWIQPIAS